MLRSTTAPRSSSSSGWVPGHGRPTYSTIWRRCLARAISRATGRKPTYSTARRSKRLSSWAWHWLVRSRGNHDPLPHRPNRQPPSPQRASVARAMCGDGFGNDRFRLRDAKGMRYLAMLLSTPGREIHSLDLVRLDADPPDSSTRSVALEDPQSGARAGRIFRSGRRAGTEGASHTGLDSWSCARSWKRPVPGTTRSGQTDSRMRQTRLRTSSPRRSDSAAAIATPDRRWSELG